MPEGALALCDEQTQGRGRLGRSWTAPPGTAILCSLLLRPPATGSSPRSRSSPAQPSRGDRGRVGLAVQVKWPNDVMLNRRKVAGILAEASDGVVVVGIGVNVNQERGDLPESANVPAASLYTIDGVKRERAPLLVTILERLERTTTPGSSAGSTASTTASARATSCAAAGSPSTARGGSGSRSTGTAASSSTSAASSASSSPARSPTSASPPELDRHAGPTFAARPPA